MQAPAHSKCGTHILTPHGTDKGVLTCDVVRCVWCGYMWKAEPQAMKGRGFCQRYNGFVCGRPGCRRLGPRHWMHDIENIEAGRPEGTVPILVAVPAGVPGG
ncbi:MAG: hypothetical protein K2R98_08545 [Gemmataceae bacterium]|nr:hypothetical protein [Gemmataceae bacterium]